MTWVVFNEQEQNLVGKKNPRSHPLGMIVKVKPQAKKAKMDQTHSVEPLEVVSVCNVDNTSKSSGSEACGVIINNSCLVSYSDESDED